MFMFMFMFMLVCRVPNGRKNEEWTLVHAFYFICEHEGGGGGRKKAREESTERLFSTDNCYDDRILYM